MNKISANTAFTLRRQDLTDLMQILQGKKTTARAAQSFTLLSILSACGGGSGGTTPDPSTPSGPSTSGRVIDGYISGARVFRDLDNDLEWDASEDSVLTDGTGAFTGLEGSASGQIIADSNGGSAIDIATGLPFLAKLIAPGDYQVVTPVTTLVSSLTLRGVDLAQAEKIVLDGLGLSGSIDLANYDPFASSDGASADYKVAAVKVANILMASDGDLGSDSALGFSATLNAFANILQSAAGAGATLNLSDPNTLTQLIPNASPGLLAEIAEANSPESYGAILDEQLLILSDNSNASISVTTIEGSQLIAIEIGGEFNGSDNFTAKLYNASNGRFTESSELVSFGSNVALFKFSNSELQKLGAGSLELQVTNNTTSETFISDVAVSLTPGGGGGGGGGGTSETAPTDAGVVVDGYIANARVFRDADEDGEYDPGEVYVLTDGSGAYTGLGGDITKPIVADGGVLGEAIDTSTGIIFNSVMSAPAGSKVVNPITTIVNELIVSGDAPDLATANAQVATVLGLSDVANAGIDFTKFDPISNKVYGDDGSETIDPANADLAGLTQAVATFVANLVVSGANEMGGDVDAIRANTKTIITSLKNTIKTKSAETNPANKKFSFDDPDDIVSALGSSFNKASPALEKLTEQFSGFDPHSFDKDNPSATLGSFSSDALIEKQLISQSEFGDGILTSAEAANGAVLVIGPTYDAAAPAEKVAQAGIATVKITNLTEGVVLTPFPTVNFANSKYSSVELTREQLDTLGGGTLRVEVKLGNLSADTWNTSDEIIYATDAQSDLYYHEDVNHQISFDTDTVLVDISNGVALVTSSSGQGPGESLDITGTITVDVSGDLPGEVALENLVSRLSADGDGNFPGRKIALEFINSDGNVKYSTEATIDPSSSVDGANQTGAATFTWTASDLASDVDFADLEDGEYSIRASFTDVYGAPATTSFDGLEIDRNPPQVEEIVATDSSVNISDGVATFEINVTKPLASYDLGAISLKITEGETITETAINDNSIKDAISVSLNATSDKLTVTYTPTGEGTVELGIANGAFTDSSGNVSTAETSLSNHVKSFDLVAPAVATDGVDVPTELINKESGEFTATFTFSEPVAGLSLSDFTVTSIGGVKAATLSNVRKVPVVVDGETLPHSTVWKVDATPAENLEGTFTINLADRSYTDTAGNLGTAKASGSIDIDTRPAAPFQVALANEQAAYAQGEDIVIDVVFDEDLKAFANQDQAAGIGLTIGENTRFAELSGVTDNVARFTYTVTNADLSDESGVVVDDAITLGDILGADGNTVDANIGSVSDPLNLSGKVVDGGTSGAAVDGYVEGAIIYADNDQAIVPLVAAGTVFASPEFINTYSLSLETHGVATGTYGVVEEDGSINAYLLTDGSFSEVSVPLNNVAIADLGTPAAANNFWRGTETEYYALTPGDHGVSEAGNYVISEDSAGNYQAFQVLSTETPVFGDDNIDATADAGSLTLTQAYFDGGTGLTEGDAIAQADSTGGFVIYGADGPLVLEGGFDISTNKDFTVRYQAPSDYTVINPVSSLIVAGTSQTTPPEVAATILFGEMFSVSPVYQFSSADVEALKDVAALTADTFYALDVGTYKLIEVTEVSGNVGAYEPANTPVSIDLGDETGVGAVFSHLFTAEKTVSGVLPSNSGELKGVLADYASGSSDAYTLFSDYNAYDQIARAADIAINTVGGTTGDVKDVVADALVYQKAAASYALLVDFVSNAAHAANSADNKGTVLDLSDQVFAAIVDNLPALSRSFANKTFDDVYDADGAIIVGANADIIGSKSLEGTLIKELSDTFSSIPGMADLETDFPDVYEFLAQSIIAINSASANISDTSSVAESDIIAAAEAGIEALTEIVQVQSVVQANTLNDVVSYLELVALEPLTSDAAPTVDASALLGSSYETGYKAEPVGTVVPIRYEIAQESGQASAAFEGDADGVATTFDFTVTRSGSTKTTSSVNFSIEGGVTASDIAGGILNGELFFDVNEKQKTISVTLNNDSLREASETLTVVIYDPTETAMIVEDRASVTIRDDDPSTPEVSLQQATYNLSEGGTSYLKPVNVEYFDTDALFKLTWQELGGTLSVTDASGAAYDGTEYVTYFDLVTGVLRNMDFTTPGDGSAVSEAGVIFTLEAAEATDDNTLTGQPTGRLSSTEFNIDFDVHLLPSVDISSINTGADSFAGVPTNIAGVTVSDPDSEYLTVTVDSDLAGQIYSTSTANYSTVENTPTSVSFSGSVAAVQDALDNLNFEAASSGEASFTFTVDDNDSQHARADDGTLTASGASGTTDPRTIKASLPTLSQTFEPFVKVGASIWNGFSGVEVADLDSDTVTVVVSGAHGAVNMYDLTVADGVSAAGLYAYDDVNGLAYNVTGAGTKQDPYKVSSTAEAVASENITGEPVGEIGLLVNFRLGDAPAGLNAPSFQVPASELVLSGSPEYVSELLGLVQVSIAEPEADLVEVTVHDADTTGNSPINAVASPGGDALTITIYDDTITAASHVETNISIGEAPIGSGLGTFTPASGSSPATYKITGEADGTYSASTAISYGDFASTATVLAEITPSYVAVSNAPPAAGGKVTVSGVTEGSADEAAQSIEVEGIKLFDEDAKNTDGNYETPSAIRIISVTGGELFVAGQSVFDENGIPRSLTIADGDIVSVGNPERPDESVGSITLQFKPEENFTGDAKVRYVVVDPQDATRVSATSEIVVEVENVNDAPTVTLSSVPTSYTQGGDAVQVFSSVSVSDIDSTTFSEVQIVADIEADEEIIYPEEIFGMSATRADNTITYTSAGGITSADVSALLSSVKFSTPSNNLVNQTRTVTVTVTDSDNPNPLESAAVTKTITLVDVNDGPQVSTAQDAATYLEGDTQGLLMSSFGVVSDPEGHNIASVTINFEAGYRPGQDKIAPLTGSTLPATVSGEFDEATGSYTILALNEAGLTSSEVDAILGLIAYSNSSSSLVDGAEKELSLQLVDVNGAVGTSEPKTVTIEAQNDNPEVYAVVSGVEQPQGSGAQFIVSDDPTPVRVAPNIAIRDIDGSEFASATISAASTTGALGLSSSGQQLATAYNFTVEVIEATSASGPVLKIYKGAEDDSTFMGRSNLEAILKEVVYTNSVAEVADGAYDTVTVSVKDNLYAASNPDGDFTSKITLLNTPSVEVAKVTTDAAENDYTATGAAASSVVNVLTFNADADGNPLFVTNQLTVDLSTSTIRSEGIRYQYDASTTEDKLALNKASHVDLEDLGGTSGTTTTVIGLTSANVIIGSKFSDFIDGNGGKDVIRAGGGDDTVVLRLGTEGAAFYGGDGVDTLVLPKILPDGVGGFDLSNIGAYAANVTVGTDFENTDASAVSAGLTLKGNASANELRAGAGVDEIWLGTGGDTAHGGEGGDTFVIDLSQDAESGEFIANGASILDLKSDDQIKFSVDGATFLASSAFDWQHGADFETTSTGATYSASVVESAAGNILKIKDNSSGELAEIYIGTSLFGALGKWDQVGDEFTLQPTKNTAPSFVLRGETTSATDPITLQAVGEAETTSTYKFSYTLSGDGNVVSVADADTDDLQLTVSYQGVDVNLPGGTTEAGSSDITLVGSPAAINTALTSLTVGGTSRGTGSVTLSFTDGYADPIAKTLHFEIPNSTPTLTLTGGGALSGEINTDIVLGAGDAGISVGIEDSDALDETDRTLKVFLDVRGGSASYNQRMAIEDGSEVVDLEQNYYPEFVTISGGKVTIAYDGETELPDGMKWSSLLNEIVADIGVSRSTVGSAEVSISVADLEGVPISGGSETISLEFTPAGLAAPELITTVEPVGGETLLNGAQFETAKVRIFTKDVGAQAGDEIKLTVTITSDDQSVVTKDLTKVIPSDLSDPTKAAPFVEFNLANVVDVAARNGSFSAEAELLIGGQSKSSTSEGDALTFTVDTSAPETPTVSSLRNSEGESVAPLSGEDVVSVTVAGAGELTHVIVPILPAEDGAWYNLPPNFNFDDIKSGADFVGSVSHESTHDDATGSYKLDISSGALDGAVYAIFARDLAGNVSTVDLSSFDYTSNTLPEGVFVVDKTLNQDDLGYEFAEELPSIADPSGPKYKIGLDYASAVGITIKPDGRDAELPADIVEMTVEVWSDASELGSTTVDPAMVGAFSRDIAGSEGSQWTANDPSYAGITLSETGTGSSLAPHLTFDFASGLGGVTGYVGIRISVEDAAGNVAFIDTIGDEILIDDTADAVIEDDTLVNDDIVTSLVSDAVATGITRSEAASIDVTLSGLDDDLDARVSYVLSGDQLLSALYDTGTGELVVATPADATQELVETLSLDLGFLEIQRAGVTVKVPSISDGAYYLDIEKAFVDSLISLDVEEAAPVSPGEARDWKFIGLVEDQGGSVAEYVHKSDWSKYLEGDASVKTFGSQYLVRTHNEGELTTHIDSFTQDITPLLSPDGSDDAPIFILNQVFDVAGNMSFASDILSSASTDGPLLGELRVDVKKPSVGEGLTLNQGDDTGSEPGDLVTNETRPGMTFIADEAISSARIVLVSNLDPAVSTPEVAYELAINQNSAGDGFEYSATLANASVELGHGLWALELTDLAGNVGVADASALTKVIEVYSFSANDIASLDGSGSLGITAEKYYVLDPSRMQLIEVVSDEATELETQDFKAIATGSVISLDAAGLDTFAAALAQKSPVGFLPPLFTNQDIGSVTNGVFVVDTISPPDASVTMTNVEIEGGFINQYEAMPDLSFSVLPGLDDMASDYVTANQVADIINVSIIGASGAVVDLGASPVSTVGGEETFTFDATGLVDGAYNLRITSRDTAGNSTETDYGFVLDTSGIENPLNQFTLSGVNSSAAGSYAGDYVLNRSEIGYGPDGEDLTLDLSLVQGGSIVSIMVGDGYDSVSEEFAREYQLWGLDYDLVSGGVATYQFKEGEFGVGSAGDYVVNRLSESVYEARLVSGNGTSEEPYILGEAFALQDFSAREVPDGFIRSSLLDKFYEQNSQPLSSLNLVEAIKPGAAHDEKHAITVVVSDAAGNLSTQTLDFVIDTRLADAPEVVVERGISSTAAVDLDYWEAKDGVRIQISELGSDQLLQDSLRVNGEVVDIIDASRGIFEISPNTLVDSATGLKAVGYVDVLVDGLMTSRPVFSLTAADHGVTVNGNYVLVEDVGAQSGFNAFGVNGDGTNTPFTVSETQDSNGLSAMLLSGTNVVTYDVVDEYGNANSFTTFFTTDLADPTVVEPGANQYFAVVPTLAEVNSGAGTALILDVFASDLAMQFASENTKYEGSVTFDLIFDVPAALLSSQLASDSFSYNSAFGQYASAIHDLEAGQIIFYAVADNGGVVESELALDNDAPILSVTVELDAMGSLVDIQDTIGLSVAKISEVPIYPEEDSLGLKYEINLSDLIVTTIGDL